MIRDIIFIVAILLLGIHAVLLSKRMDILSERMEVVRVRLDILKAPNVRLLHDEGSPTPPENIHNDR